MESSLFLMADDQPISLGQALRYLESAGKLDFVLWEIMRQHVLAQELQVLEESKISAGVIEQTVIEFRLEHQLTNYEIFGSASNNGGIGNDLMPSPRLSRQSCTLRWGRL